MSASGRYEKLAADRDSYLDRARECAELTIPSLLPYEGFTYSNDLYQPYQSVGSRGVNNLASKLLLLLFPPNSPFFRLAIDSKTKKELENFDINKEFKRIKTNESKISISVNSLFDKWIAS